LKYIVPKGSIAIDGISLTVADILGGLLIISVVPHTAQATILGKKSIGDLVNIEVDLLSKYVEKHLLGREPVGVTSDILDQVGFFPMGWIEN
ncbi:MAG: riboflavin synthase, partial [Candidatus Margulisbacteria bacterium]|nr:riboflavin synthase [Candidatus Margulisiibacteriota bacterium]